MRADPITDPRLRVAALLALAFGFSALHGPAALALMVAATLGLVWWSGTPARRLLRALRLPGVVVAGLVVVLPFTSGDHVIAAFGPRPCAPKGWQRPQASPCGSSRSLR